MTGSLTMLTSEHEQWLIHVVITYNPTDNLLGGWVGGGNFIFR